jgi:hypothetical protein
MNYFCENCNYVTQNSGNFTHHKKTKKHLLQLAIKSNINNENIAKTSKKLTLTSTDNNSDKDSLTNNKMYFCDNCNKEFKHDSSYYRHKKTCKSNNESIKELKLKLELERREKELYQKLEKEKSELLTNFMANANNIIDKAQNNTKVTAEAMKSVSMSALKYANEKFKNTPALLPLENFNINNLDFNNEEDKKQLVEILIYNGKQKSLDKLLGDHIVKNYKKDNPEEQSFHTTDCSRLNFIVRDLIENALSWSMDKNGFKICSSIIKPLIKKCIDILLEHQKLLLQSMSSGGFNKQKDVELIIDVLMSIDSGSLETDINKYIAPYFNLDKK